MQKAVENLFTFDETFFVSAAYRIYTNAVLKRDFGRFKTGSVVPEVHIHGLTMTMIEDPDDRIMPSSEEFNFSL